MARTQKTQTAPRDEAPSAADLIVAFENGDESQAQALIQTLGQRDFAHVAGVMQKATAALASYAASWAGVELP